MSEIAACCDNNKLKVPASKLYRQVSELKVNQEENHHTEQILINYFREVGLRGGGIIELVAETVIINGKVTSDAISMKQDQINTAIHAFGSRIKIRCKEFINNGGVSAMGLTSIDKGQVAIYC